MYQLSPRTRGIAGLLFSGSGGTDIRPIATDISEVLQKIDEYFISMKIDFHLLWAPQKLTEKSFKFDSCRQLFAGYTQKIAHFSPCHAHGAGLDFEDRQARSLWLCDRTKGSLILSSEALAEKLNRLQSSGIRSLEVIVGGADGLSHKEMKDLEPIDLRWSFGHLTLPHELAAVVAAEQIYRAFTIINHQPYHSGH